MKALPKYFLLMAMSLSGGCSRLHGPNLLETGGVCLRNEHAGTASIRRLLVVQDGPSLLVEGVIDGRLAAPKEVSLLLQGPDGATLASGVGTLLRAGRRVQGHRFSFVLPAVPPEGSTLRIAY